jgi:hypothetical protein
MYFPPIGLYLQLNMSRYLTGNRGSISYREQMFCSSQRPVLGLTHYPMQWIRGALSPEVNRPASKADHSPPSVSGLGTHGAPLPLPHTPPWLITYRAGLLQVMSTKQSSVTYWVIYRLQELYSVEWSEKMIMNSN